MPRRTRSTSAPAKAKGPAAPSNPASKKKAAAKKAGPTNEDIINTFQLLALYETKIGGTWQSKAYKGVVDALSKVKTQITCGQDVANLKGVGAASIKKIDELIASGKVKRLEELKEDVGELPAAVTSAFIGGAGPLKSGGAAGKKSSPAAAKAGKKKTDPATGKKKSSGAGGKSDGSPKPEKITAATKKKIDSARSDLMMKSIPELKDLARFNDQKIGGNKDELADRLCHQVVLGAVPRCPLCGGGKLRYDMVGREYSCPGFYDDDEYKACIFRTNRVTRLPWKTSF